MALVIQILYFDSFCVIDFPLSLVLFKYVDTIDTIIPKLRSGNFFGGLSKSNLSCICGYRFDRSILKLEAQLIPFKEHL